MKLPPHFTEGETAILGACLLENSCIPMIADILTASDFYHERNRVLFQAIMEIHDRGDSPDWVSITAALQKLGKFEAVGGSPYLTDLVDAVPSIANVYHYAGLVKEKSKLRQVISAASEIAARCYDTESTLDEVMQDFQKSAFEIAIDEEKGSGLVHVSEVLKDGVTAIERAGEKGIKTGLGRVDQIFDGFFDGDLTLIGGRPSMGKTAFVADILDYVSRKEPCALFSLEMANAQNGVRLLAKKTGLNLRSLRRGLVGPSDWPKIQTAAGQLSERKLYVDQSVYITVPKIRNRIRHLAVKSGVQIKLIAIDYLQLALPATSQQNREREIGTISRGLKLLARELGIPVIALSQLSRKLEERPAKNCGRRPILSDLRDSGSLEQDADAVIFVFRQEVYEQDNSDVKGKAEIIIGKQRNGAIGTALVAWDATTATFRDPDAFHNESKYMEAV
jgi:replicative DNA helicase